MHETNVAAQKCIIFLIEFNLSRLRIQNKVRLNRGCDRLFTSFMLGMFFYITALIPSEKE